MLLNVLWQIFIELQHYEIQSSLDMIIVWKVIILKINSKPWSSNAWVNSCPITTPIPPKLRALEKK